MHNWQSRGREFEPLQVHQLTKELNPVPPFLEKYHFEPLNLTPPMLGLPLRKPPAYVQSDRGATDGGSHPKVVYPLPFVAKTITERSAQRIFRAADQILRAGYPG